MAYRHLDTLLAIVDLGSFDAAASALGISPSAVSQRIKTLESEAGRVLIRRSTPPTATPAGEILVQTARRMQLLQREASLHLGGNLSAVPLTVAVNADSLGTWFQRILPDVGALTTIDLYIRVEDEKHSLRLLRRGDCMAAVTTEGSPVAGCQSEYLGIQRYVAVAAPKVAALLDSGEHTFATLPAARFGSKDHMEESFLEEHWEEFDSGVHGPGRSPERQYENRRESRVPSFEALTAAMVAGTGWGMVPERQAAPLIERGLLVWLMEGKYLDVPLYWQRWKVESQQLEQLSDSIHAAAAVELL